MSRSDNQIKRMADLLKSGATMLFEHCPECNTTLFKIRGERWCPKCDKRVIIIGRGEETKVASMLLLDDTEKTIMIKIQEISQGIRNEMNVSKLLEMGNLLLKWFEILEKLRNIRKERT